VAIGCACKRSNAMPSPQSTHAPCVASSSRFKRSLNCTQLDKVALGFEHPQAGRGNRDGLITHVADPEIFASIAFIEGSAIPYRHALEQNAFASAQELLDAHPAVGGQDVHGSSSSLSSASTLLTGVQGTRHRRLTQINNGADGEPQLCPRGGMPLGVPSYPFHLPLPAAWLKIPIPLSCFTSFVRRSPI
jgi:hypothetical protein